MFGEHQRQPVAKAGEFTAVHREADKLVPRTVSVWRQLDGAISISDATKGLSNFGSLEKVVQSAYSDLVPELEARAITGGTRGAQLGISEAVIDLDLALVNPLVERFAAKNAGALVTEGTKEQLRAIKSIIRLGVREGEAPRILARQIQHSIGLHSRQANALNRYRIGLQAAGRKPSVIDRLVAGRYQKALKTRAETIARTEVMSALNQGQRNAWNIAASEGLIPKGSKRVWIANSSTNHQECMDLNGTKVGLEEEFSVGDPPWHPRCVCTYGLSK